MRQGLRRAFWILAILGAMGFAAGTQVATAAYHHMGEIDSASFQAVHPEKAGSKLDSCSLCHSGGTMTSGGREVAVGSCQWCHYSFGYDSHGDIMLTLNQYGKDYLAKGRSADAIKAIESMDSDGDGYSNADEIAATRYPGDEKDDPTKVPAPYKVYSRDQLEQMSQHTQVMLMNAQKSMDFYAEYTGVPVEELMKGLALPSASSITVFSPDGFAQYHPMEPDAGLYHINGGYPEGSFYYDEQADVAKNPTDGWCDYSSPSVAGLVNEGTIVNPEGLKLLLGIRKDGEYIETGVLNTQNKLDGEGPYRIIPPQTVPSHPDQGSSAKNQDVTWPYGQEIDHNAGAGTRSATIIRVEPLPVGTTDIDILEAGWDFVDQAKIVVYGAIDPVPTVQQDLDSLIATVQGTADTALGGKDKKAALLNDLNGVKKQVEAGSYSEALKAIQDGMLPKLKDASQGGWISNGDLQKRLYWAANEIAVLLKTVA